jgi:hypothetical protein
VTITAHTTTGAIAQRLWTVHWTSHTCFTESALATGLRIEQKAFNQLFNASDT